MKTDLVDVYRFKYCIHKCTQLHITPWFWTNWDSWSIFRTWAQWNECNVLEKSIIQLRLTFQTIWKDSYLFTIDKRCKGIHQQLIHCMHHVELTGWPFTDQHLLHCMHHVDFTPWPSMDLHILYCMHHVGLRPSNIAQTVANYKHKNKNYFEFHWNVRHFLL